MPTRLSVESWTSVNPRTQIVGNAIAQRLLVYISWFLPVHLTIFPKPKKRHKPNLEMGTSFFVSIAVRSYVFRALLRSSLG